MKTWRSSQRQEVYLPFLQAITPTVVENHLQRIRQLADMFGAWIREGAVGLPAKGGGSHDYAPLARGGGRQPWGGCGRGEAGQDSGP